MSHVGGQYAKTCGENKIEIGNDITESNTYDSVSKCHGQQVY